MRQQPWGRRFLSGLLATVVTGTLLINLPLANADEDLFAPDDTEMLQTEPPPVSEQAPTKRATPRTKAKVTRPAATSRKPRWGGLHFFNPRNPRNVPKDAGGKVAAVAEPRNSHATKIAWQTDFKTAQVTASKAHKPLLVVFGAARCPSCRRMDREVLTRPEIAEQIQRDFVAVHVDADKHEELTELLEVDRIPAMIVLNGDMEIVNRVDGYQSARNLSMALKRPTATGEQKVRQVKLEESASEE